MITVPDAIESHERDMCETCSGTASITANPDAENVTEGVSLKNTQTLTQQVPHTPTIDEILSPDYKQPEGYNWYYLRVSYGRAEKLYNELKDRKDGYLLWMPYQKVVRYENGKKYESLTPFFKSNIFIYSTMEMAKSLTCRDHDTGYSFVSFAYDHTVGTRNVVVSIRFREMLNFIQAEQVHHPWAHVVKEQDIHFRPGGMVRVVGGAFKGVTGRVARVYGQTRVVVTIQGVMNYATAYISPKYMEPIDDDNA